MALSKAWKPSKMAACGSRSGNAASMRAQAADRPASSTASSIARAACGLAQFAGEVAELLELPGAPCDLDDVAGLPGRPRLARDAAGDEAGVAAVQACQQRRHQPGLSVRPARQHDAVIAPLHARGYDVFRQFALGCGMSLIGRRRLLGAGALGVILPATCPLASSRRPPLPPGHASRRVCSRAT